MIEIDPRFPILALASGALAVVVWLVVLVRTFRAREAGLERRRAPSLVMPISALIVSFGTLASAVGFANQRGFLIMAIDADALSLVSSMGRGALVAAGLIYLFSYRPRLK